MVRTMIGITLTKTLSKAVRFLMILLLAALPLLLAAGAQAQNGFDKGTPAESKGGLSSLSTYARDKIETVNLANGNLNLHIPLVTIGGRGSAGFTVALSYNSKVWTGQHDVETEPVPIGQPARTLDHFTATFNDGVERTPNVISLGSGWQISKGPAVQALISNLSIGVKTRCSTRQRTTATSRAKP